MTASKATDPADRGRLHISTLVLRRIAEHAADRTAGTIIGSGRGRAGGAVATRAVATGAAATVRGDTVEVDVDLDVTLVYPRPVREVARRLRDAVASDIDRLTGRKVRRVAITVVGLRPYLRPRVE